MKEEKTFSNLDYDKLLEVLIAYKDGDFTKRMPNDLTGVEGKVADTINEIITQSNKYLEKIDKYNKIVGEEGKVKSKLDYDSYSGKWETGLEKINALTETLSTPILEVSEIMKQIYSGNLTGNMELKKEGKQLKGEYLKLGKNTNKTIDKLKMFSNEVIRVASEVGIEGQLGGKAEIENISGIWKDLTDSVNVMAKNITNQVRNIAEVTTAVAKGDLSKKIDVEVKGEIQEMKNTINTMVDQLNNFASEVIRVAKEVGTDGILGGQANVKDISGTWWDLTDNVNSMANNLTSQVRNIAEVTTAVAKGDLTKQITVEAKGEIQELKNTINTMVDQLSSFSSEVTRVAKEVGTEGILGGQANVEGVAGTWKDLTNSVNYMANNLTDQVRNIAEVTTAVANGDLTSKITVEARGEIQELKSTINTMVDQLNSFASEVTRVAKEVGTEGILGGQADVEGVSGTWKDLTNSVNSMANNLTSQVRNIAEVTTAVANGDLAKQITVEAKGEIQELKSTINTMVDQLNSFASEVTRVAKEVGNDGILGGQANVKGVSGIWRDLTENVNSMANNLTDQVRNIAEVTTAVANGDLTSKITVEAQGEIQELKNTINTMVDQLNSFASEVTRVAKEVGIDGILGGQANVEGVSGIWRDLTKNVNSMADNLTNQVRNIAEVTTAVAKGDLEKKISVEAQGEIQELKNTINTMVDQLSSFASEVTRVASEVGIDGKLGGQANVEGVSGTWKALTESVNSMASNLTNQVRNIAEVTTAVATGDLTKQITVEAQGEIEELKNTINTMVFQLNSFASEVTRVAKEVGTEGILGGQADVEGVSGTWKDLTNSVNSMADNLTNQVRNIAEVTTAVAKGDLEKKISVEAQGEIQELKDTINTMVDQLSSFASEVTRVASEVGTEGKLGGQANVEGVSGTWKDLTNSVNSMASNLTDQVRAIAEVTTGVATGDLTKLITVEAQGEILELKSTINTMVDQLSSFASEVTRVAKEVGTDGILGGQADVKGVAGIWKDLTENVNSMASNLTTQVRGIAEVTTAVAKGDLAKKIQVEAKGEILELKSTINIMVDQLSSFASEVTRVAREVGTSGKLGGQANVEGVSGIWKDLTENVNSMASNLTDQVRAIAQVTTAVANGDLSKKISVDAKGEIQELKNTINIMVDQLSSFAEEVTRVAREVGVDGKLGGQAYVKGVAGTWKDLTDNVNLMASNLTDQVRNIAEVTTAVANGDLTSKITVEAKGEILKMKNTLNTMVDQLNSFASEVTRVAREVGTDGILGGQADVKGVAGIWKDLTDNVNSMGANLTTQVRGIAKVVTAVAQGDLMKKLTVEAKGEIATLADTINSMTDTLKVFADQVTSVAREVGVEGKLGGQADVPGASGIWKDLTDNVNQLAGNLTTQVRSISEVATAVAKGDHSRTISVIASGEVEELKDNINQMIANLKKTTLINTEQDWLKTNLTKFTRNLQGQKELMIVSKLILSELAKLISIQHGVFYLVENIEEEISINLLSSFAYNNRKHLSNKFKLGESLIGQVALEKERIIVNEVPGDYVVISSGLGEAKPYNLAVIPIIFENEVKAIMELASFNKFKDIHISFIDQLTESIGIVINTIQATMQTEELLQQSQSLTEKLKMQQEELQKTNEELEEKAGLLEKQNKEVERKNKEVEKKNDEVELAKVSLEEKAKQLALTSKYKSQFLANMSHELRTPLNSLLMLSEILTQNKEKNLNKKQTDYANTILNSGKDLLTLINDILDLSKIESGTVSLEVSKVSFDDLTDFLNKSFDEIALSKNLNFNIQLDKNTPEITTDGKKLKQILKNLLSNAFKFTNEGEVKLEIKEAESGWDITNDALNRADKVIVFDVSDTGIGIPKNKHKLIFEAFQQVDGTTSRKYGGTGLGFSICRELSNILGGEIILKSEKNKGSSFRLFLPNVIGSKEINYFKGINEVAQTKTNIEEKNNIEISNTFDVEIAEELSIELPDDRNSIGDEDNVLLIIEDDIRFAKIVAENARIHGFKVIYTYLGSVGFRLAEKYLPDAIILDLHLPDSNGYTILDMLKQNLKTRHIPIHIISVDEPTMKAMEFGALSYLNKPIKNEDLERELDKIQNYIERKVKKLLLIEDDELQIDSIREVIGNNDVVTTVVTTGGEAIEKMKEEKFDCVILDLILPDVDGIDLIREISEDKEIHSAPTIIYTAMDINKEQELELKKYAKTIILKDVNSKERLLDETSLFLHRIAENLPEEKRVIIENITKFDISLKDKKILLIDDDIRNIYAISGALEEYGLNVIYREDAISGIELLKENPDTDLVLMDIMLPEVDGYEATKRIRRIEEFKDLPIIALTAKAMLGDKEKCLKAGATDYISKPVSIKQLISLLRVWLYR